MKAYALPPSYYRGAAARDEGMRKDAPGHLGPVWRSWWLAGWNDRDIELTTYRSGQLATEEFSAADVQ